MNEHEQKHLLDEADSRRKRLRENPESLEEKVAALMLEIERQRFALELSDIADYRAGYAAYGK